MYKIEVKGSLDKIFDKLSKKDKHQMEIILRKIKEVVQNPSHYKNLRAPLQHLKRVHIDKNFVLVFSVDENTKTVVFENYDHHDNLYR